MIDVHVGRVAAQGRTLASPVLDRLLLKAKRDWLTAAKGIRATLDNRVKLGIWPESLAQRLQHWVDQMEEAEISINELVMVDTEFTRWRDSGALERGAR